MSRKPLSCYGTALKDEAPERHLEKRPPVYSAQANCVNNCELPIPERGSERLQFGNLDPDVTLDTNVVKWLVKPDESKCDSVHIPPAVRSEKLSGKDQLVSRELCISEEEWSAPALRLDG